MAEFINQYLHESGTNLYFSTVPLTSAGNAFVLVNNLNTVDPPEIKKGRAAATSVSDSLGTKQMRKRPGWQDPGELKFTAYRDAGSPAAAGTILAATGGQFDTLMAFYFAETILYWRLQTRDGQDHFFTAWIGNIKPLGTIQRDSDELLLDEYTLVLTDDLPVHGTVNNTTAQVI